jgi:hypothetical protein
MMEKCGSEGPILYGQGLDCEMGGIAFRAVVPSHTGINVNSTSRSPVMSHGLDATATVGLPNPVAET